jgi:hypothetical protein
MSEGIVQMIKHLSSLAYVRPWVQSPPLQKHHTYFFLPDLTFFPSLNWLECVSSTILKRSGKEC